MSIVKMKRLRLCALSDDKESMLHALMELGCVHISQQEEKMEDPAWAELVHVDESGLQRVTERYHKIETALKTLDRYAPEKSGLFATRKEIRKEQLFDPAMREEMLLAADQIKEAQAGIQQSLAEQSKLQNRMLALQPWESSDLPLELSNTTYTVIQRATLPNSVSVEEVQKTLLARVPEAVIERVSQDGQLQYLVLISHKASEEEALEVLKSFGWSPVRFADGQGTAKEQGKLLWKQKRALEKEISDLEKEIAAFAPKRDRLKLCLDLLTQDMAKEQAKEQLLATTSVFFLEGWASVPQQEALEKLLQSYACAYELSDPTPEDNVPIQLKGNRLTEPMNMVTEMYSLPAYGNIDPNGLIMPFFTLFFGIMYADLGYGLLLILLSLFVKWKFKPRNTVGHMMGLMLLCGITTAVFGVLFGSFFGDAIPVMTETFGSARVELWSLINPLENPMVVLIGSVVLGVIHILFGMGVKVYICIRDKRYLDALFDVGSWWLLFAGIVVLVLGGGFWVLIAGALALVLTQGRKSPTLVGKLMGGLSSLYDITSYLSDILSYTRLMALLLATAVIASVVNILGSLTGSLIAFIIIFLVGHLFNMGINIIGTYVHAARLQYLEFFSKFYEEGGTPFTPLKIKTKYYDVVQK